MAILAGDCRSTTFIVSDESYDDLLLKTHVKQTKKKLIWFKMDTKFY